MLWLVYGIPGTGKTLIGGIEDSLIPAVQEGRRVYTNISGLSIAGISTIANVPPIKVRINYLETIEDVLSAFDSEDSTNSIFILDEMRQVLAGDEKLENWLSQRLNIMRKRSIDFIMIAQVPSYFSSELRELAQGCTLYRRMYSLGSKNHTREYKWDSGTPRIVANKPRDYSGYAIRKIKPELFPCYKSYIDDQIKGNEDKSNRVPSFWKSPKAIIAYLFIFFAISIITFGIVMVFHIRSSVGEFTDSLTGIKTNEVGSYDEPKTTAAIPKKEDCYTWVLCDTDFCKTDVGTFPLSSYFPSDNLFITSDKQFSLCGVD